MASSPLLSAEMSFALVVTEPDTLKLPQELEHRCGPVLSNAGFPDGPPTSTGQFLSFLLPYVQWFAQDF